MSLPKNKRFIEYWVQIFSMYFRLKLLFPIWQEVHLDVRVAATRYIFYRQLTSFQNLISGNQMSFEFDR